MKKKTSKKILLIISIIVLVLVLSTCKFKLMKPSESVENFKFYMYGITEIVKKHGYDPSIIKENWTGAASRKGLPYDIKYTIQIDDKSHIDIILQNSGDDGNSPGRENFCITYDVDENEEITTLYNYNIALITEIVNLVSVCVVSEDYLVYFLNSSEEKFNTQSGNYTAKTIDKRKDLDYFVNAAINYSMYKDNTQIITFAGLTKGIKY